MSQSNRQQSSSAAQQTGGPPHPTSNSSASQFRTEPPQNNSQVIQGLQGGGEGAQRQIQAFQSASESEQHHQQQQQTGISSGTNNNENHSRYNNRQQNPSTYQDQQDYHQQQFYPPQYVGYNDYQQDEFQYSRGRGRQQSFRGGGRVQQQQNSRGNRRRVINHQRGTVEQQQPSQEQIINYQRVSQQQQQPQQFQDQQTRPTHQIYMQVLQQPPQVPAHIERRGAPPVYHQQIPSNNQQRRIYYQDEMYEYVDLPQQQHQPQPYQQYQHQPGTIVQYGGNRTQQQTQGQFPQNQTSVQQQSRNQSHQIHQRSRGAHANRGIRGRGGSHPTYVHHVPFQGGFDQAAVMQRTDTRNFHQQQPYYIDEVDRTQEEYIDVPIQGYNVQHRAQVTQPRRLNPNQSHQFEAQQAPPIIVEQDHRKQASYVIHRRSEASQPQFYNDDEIFVEDAAHELDESEQRNHRINVRASRAKAAPLDGGHSTSAQQPILEVEPVIPLPKPCTSTPLTKTSRVLRRGRGQRAGAPFAPDEIEELDSDAQSPSEVLPPQPVLQISESGQRYKLNKRSGGRGQRGTNEHRPQYQVNQEMGGAGRGHGQGRQTRTYDNQIYAQDGGIIPPPYPNEDDVYYRHQGQQIGRKQGYRDQNLYYNQVDYILDEEPLEADYLNQPEYNERYGDYGDEDQYYNMGGMQISQQQRMVTGVRPHRYPMKTFDDDSDQSSGGDTQARRGPKIIKFKQKKPSERLALSQLKSEKDDNQEGIEDLFTPQNTQKHTNKVKILRPYMGMQGFEQPEFYQGPQWKFIRQSTNQNSKQKHYEKGDYDKVQYNFPGAENQNKDTDESGGGQKLYPPIDDFSDEDVGIAPSSSNLRAKVSFNKSTRLEVDKASSHQLTSHLNLLQSQLDQHSRDQPKAQKCKKPAVAQKAFVFDQKKQEDTGSSSQEKLLITGLTDDHTVNMENAEKFFVKEQESMIQERKNNVQFFEQYMNDKDDQSTKNIEINLDSGLMWKGLVRINPRFRHRAYVSIQELNVDILVEGYQFMNRAMDGDTVLIDLLPVHQWIEMADQQSHNAKISSFCPKTGQKIELMKGNHQGDDQMYTNETAIEQRIVDNRNPKVEKQQSDALSMSQSQSEDDTNINHGPNKGILSKLRPKKFMNDEDHEVNDYEGYIASNSDNNLTSRDRIKDLISDRNNRKDKKKQIGKLSESSVSEKGINQAQIAGKRLHLNQEDEKDLWEHLEAAGVKGVVDDTDFIELSDPETPFDPENVIKKKQKQEKTGMTIAEFLGQEDINPKNSKEKVSSFSRKELYGSKKQRIDQINSHGETLRPLAKIVGLVKSPNREQQQMVTLIEIMEDMKGKYRENRVEANNKEQAQSIIFAVPINNKLPWFIVTEAPPDYIQDKKLGKNPYHRYYSVQYLDWRINQKRPHCQVIESIGEAGNLEAESFRILRSHEICPDKYGDDEGGTHVHECLKVFKSDQKNNEWQIPKAELDQRLDLRSKRIFTIDPITAKDMDDALSLDGPFENNQYEIGVHIADVSYFVQQGSDLDKEALKRGTSTYFVHKVFPMLPQLLSEKLCSLNPNVDRLAYSLFFRLDGTTGELVKDFEPRLQRSVIRSCAKWNYEFVQKLIQGKKQLSKTESETIAGHKVQDLIRDIEIMNQLAQLRRRTRLEQGSFVFSNREFNFTLNQQTLKPMKYSESPKMESKQLVEEFMLLANSIVGEFLMKYAQDKSLLRVHQDIEQTKKNQLVNFFRKIGLTDLDLSDSKTLNDTMNKLKQLPQGEDKYTVVNRKLLTCLQMARYQCVENQDADDLRHFGLNFPIYTHFTSPIRRYADLLVHRLITICLKEKENTRSKMDGIDYAEYAEEISNKCFSARKASKDCQTLFQCLLLREYGPRVYESLVFDIEFNTMTVYIEELNLHLMIRLRDDRRIDQTTFFEDELKLACTFIEPLNLADHTSIMPGDQKEHLLNKSKGLRKIEEEAKRMTEDRIDQRIRLNQQPQHDDLRQLGATNIVFSIFDKVRVKLEATDTYPMELLPTLLITRDDLIEYKRNSKQQSAREGLSSGHSQQIGGFLNDLEF